MFRYNFRYSFKCSFSYRKVWSWSINIASILALLAMLFLSTSLASTSLASGQSIPPYINYQGRLVDQASGGPVNGVKSITFSLYDSATGGTAIYSQTQQVNIVNGAFSVYLGKGDKGEGNYQGEKVSDGIPAAVFTEHSARYLGVKIEGSSSEMTPRQLLASVAYSYKAERAREAENLMGQVTVDVSSGSVGIGTSSPGARLHVAGGDATAGGVTAGGVTAGDTDNKAFIRASNFNPVPAAYWPDFDVAAPFLLKNALWVGWDDTEKAWKYYKESDNDRGLTDPGNPTGWSVNGTTIGYFNGNLDRLAPGTHINNRYNPEMMASRCNQDDIQVKVGSFWVDKYACRIIDVGANYTGTVWKDDSADMQTSANLDVPPYWMAFSQKDRGSTGMTWFVAAKAAVSAGKRMPSNAEWQAAALGTARSSGNVANGSTWASVADQDVAQYGVVGMAGNLWEWVADWGQYGTKTNMTTGDYYSATAWGPRYGDDGTWNIDGTANTSDDGRGWVSRLPAALLRGDSWGSGTEAGVFAIHAHSAPSNWYDGIGFRCSR
jgi:formylglycine-generating enzyme required for sulfatase activity